MGGGTRVGAQKRRDKNESTGITWLPFMLRSLSQHAKRGSTTEAT